MANLTMLELSDRAQITDLLYRYAKGIDDQNWEQVLSCFAPEIHLEVLGRTVIGISEVRRFFRGELGGPKAAVGIDRITASTHVLANILIELAGDDASADTQGVANLQASRDGRDIFLVRGVRYIDTLKRIDGEWLIVLRRHTQSWQFESAPVPMSKG